MLFARISFVPNHDHEEAELVSAAEQFLSALYRNGQIVGESVAGWYDGIYDALVYASHRDALHPRYYSRWVRAALAEIHAGFGADPVCEILDDNVSWPVPTLKSASSLFLYCESLSGTSPVRHGNRGTPVAVPLLPADDGLRDRLCDWQTSYTDHDRIFLGGGPLEIPAYHQLADPFSELMTEGRQLAAEVEQVTGVRVYSYLLRHWGQPEAEEDRLCPGCGQLWRSGSSPYPSREPFHRFHFCCDPCRLVSHVASVSDAELAEIGQHQPGREIAPRPDPVARMLAAASPDEVATPSGTNLSAEGEPAVSKTSDAASKQPSASAARAVDDAPELAVDRSEPALDNTGSTEQATEADEPGAEAVNPSNGDLDGDLDGDLGRMMGREAVRESAGQTSGRPSAEPSGQSSGQSSNPQSPQPSAD